MLAAATRPLRAARRPRVDAVEVVPGLWLGSAPSRAQAAALAEIGVDAVVDLRAEIDDRAGRLWRDGVRVHRARLEDHGAPSPEELRAAATLVASLMGEGRTVLVHCRAGMERGPTVACAALMLQGWSLDEAYRRISDLRKRTLPTDGQLAALIALLPTRA